MGVGIRRTAVITAAGLALTLAAAAPSSAAPPAKTCEGQVQTDSVTATPLVDLSAEELNQIRSDIGVGAGVDDFDWIHGTPGLFITGSPEDDVMIGTRNTDIIYTGGGGRDLVCAFGGNDLVLGLGDGGSRAYLGPGHDVFARGGQNWRVNGGPGSDVIDASDGSTIRGGVGNDMLLANGSAVTARGGAGDDYILDTAGHGHTLRGGPGNDFIVGRSTQLVHGGTGHDYLTGESGVVRGGGGNDIIYGRNATLVRGGPGDDACIGRACERDPGDAVSPGIPDLADHLWTG